MVGGCEGLAEFLAENFKGLDKNTRRGSWEIIRDPINCRRHMETYFLEFMNSITGLCVASRM